MKRMPPAVAGLLIVNLVVFAAGFLMPGGSRQLEVWGALWYPANGHFGVWQMVSYMFLHANLSHIFFNMFALVSFGQILETQWGAKRFLLFYFLCGVGAALVQTGLNWHEFNGYRDSLVAAGLTPAAIRDALAIGSSESSIDPVTMAELVKLYQVYASPMIGASGAIYGVLVAFGVLYPNAKLALMFVPMPIPAKYFIPGLLVLDLFSGVTGFSIFGTSIAHFAHLGGAAIGFLLMLVWRQHGRGATGFNRTGDVGNFR
jgi:membrane associated rhomboid family serine protease